MENPRTSSDKYVRLSDGRRLAYAEYGDPAGRPVFFFHGNPGSRLVHHPDRSIAVSAGARIIAPDRPGFGLSDFQEGRVLLDWPDDVNQLADHLHLDRFAVVGWSAGGPHAVACMAKIPARLAGAVLIGGAAPLDRPNAYQGMHETYRMAFRLAKKNNLFLKPMLWLQTYTTTRDPEKVLEQTANLLSPDDQKILARPDIKAQVMQYLPESARQGIDGITREAKILVTSWGLDLAKIKCPVKLWYWDDDLIVPPAMGRYLADRIPHTEARFLPGGGHFAWFDYWHDILEDLMASWPESESIKQDRWDNLSNRVPGKEFVRELAFRLHRGLGKKSYRT